MSIEFQTIKYKDNPASIISEAIGFKLTEDQWLNLTADMLHDPKHGRKIKVRIVKPERIITPYGVIRWLGVEVDFWCRVDKMVQYVEERIPPAIWVNGVERRDTSDGWGYMLSFEIRSNIIKGGVSL